MALTFTDQAITNIRAINAYIDRLRMAYGTAEQLPDFPNPYWEAKRSWENVLRSILTSDGEYGAEDDMSLTGWMGNDDWRIFVGVIAHRQHNYCRKTECDMLLSRDGQRLWSYKTNPTNLCGDEPGDHLWKYDNSALPVEWRVHS